MSRTVTTLVLSETERPVVIFALRRARHRGLVEYDPTQVIRAIGEFEAGDAMRLGPPAACAIDDVLAWTNSTGQRARWDKHDLTVLQGVRARLARRDAEPAPTGRFEVEEVMALW